MDLDHPTRLREGDKLSDGFIVKGVGKCDFRNLVPVLGREPGSDKRGTRFLPLNTPLTGVVRRLAPDMAGTVFDGAAVRSADELALAVIRFAFQQGMPADPNVKPSLTISNVAFDIADKQEAEQRDDAQAIEWFGECIGDLANVAQEWLNENIAPDGYSFVWNDGFILMSNAEFIEGSK